MKLIAYLKTGPTASHADGGRHPAFTLHDMFDPWRSEQLARTLEAACFDACFLADTFGIPNVYGGTFRTYAERGGQISYLDPMLVLPLTARWAEAIFAASHGKASSIAFRTDIRQHMQAVGRPLDEYAMLTSMAIVIDETEAAAREKAAQPDAVAAAQGSAGIAERMRPVAHAEGISYAAAARKPRSVVAGMAPSIADQMQDVFDPGGCDGFIWPTVSPATFEEFGRVVVPGLQRRGLVPKHRAPGTLRERLQG